MATRTFAGSIVGFLLVVLTVGCSGSSADKSGGERVKVTTLHMASGNSQALELEPFGEAVARVSHGKLRIVLENGWRRGRVDYEAALIRDVQAGKADLGWVGSRAWDGVGVSSFDALHAPLLVDSYALQQKVIESSIPEQMEKGLEPLGLVGLGILPGPMRKPLSSRALVRPGAFKGLRIAIQQSRVAMETLRALGATPVAIPSAGRIDAFDGVEQHLVSIYGNGYDTSVKHLAGNVNLWPRTIVLFMNKRTFAALEPAQRELLRKAARESLAGTQATVMASEQDAAAALCRRGVRFDTATAADLAALRSALMPVYSVMEREPQTRSFIESIRELRAKLGAHPAAAACAGATTSAPSERTTEIDGIYRVHVTSEQVAKHDGVPPEQAVAENYGDFVLVMDSGRFAFTQENPKACTWQYGTARLDSDELRWTFTDGGGIAPNNAQNKPGERFTWRWSLYRETLELRPVQPTDLTTVKWHRVTSTPAASALSRRCPPPADALPR